MASIGSQWHANSNGGISNLIFRVRNAENLQESARILYNGNFGIGTTAPDSTFHTVGNGHFSGNLVVGTSGLISGYQLAVVGKSTFYYNSTKYAIWDEGTFFLSDGTDTLSWSGYTGLSLSNAIVCGGNITTSAIIRGGGIYLTGDRTYLATGNYSSKLSLYPSAMNDYAEIHFSSQSGSGTNDGSLFFDIFDDSSESFIWRNSGVTKMTLDNNNLVVVNKITVNGDGHLFAKYINLGAGSDLINSYGPSFRYYSMGAGDPGYGLTVITTQTSSIRCNDGAEINVSPTEVFVGPRLVIQGVGGGILPTSTTEMLYVAGNIKATSMVLDSWDITPVVHIRDKIKFHEDSLPSSCDIYALPGKIVITNGLEVTGNISTPYNILIDSAPVMRFRGVTSTPPSSPRMGDIYYDPTANTYHFYIYDGSSWRSEY
jgi:hypothetical protein